MRGNYSMLPRTGDMEACMDECRVCGTKDNLIKVKDEDGVICYVCNSCYEAVCEGYKKVEEPVVKKKKRCK